jgi:hypothetical protein
MGYDDSKVISHKTGRIAILSILMALLGVLFFAYKVNACADKPADHFCKEEFHEVRTDVRNDFTCSEGASVEVINSPPAPKAGIMCHCPNGTLHPAPAKE